METTNNHKDIIEVSLTELTMNQNADRGYFCPEQIAELKQSIMQYGVLQPVLIDEANIVIAGNRRVRAAREAGLETIPAMVVKGNLSVIGLVENIQRADLLPMEKAEALQRIKEECSYSNQQLAAIIGKSEPSTSEILSLNFLPEDVRHECRQSDKYPLRRLVVIARSKDAKSMQLAFEALKQEIDGKAKQHTPGNSGVKMHQLAGRIAAVTTEISNINFDSLNDEQRCKLFEKLHEQDDAIHSIFSKFEKKM
jgi:ParB family chromosome partitioning protein